MIRLSFPKARRVAGAQALAALVLASACGDYQAATFRQNSEVDVSTPGLFSGENGSVLLFSSDKPQNGLVGVFAASAGGTATTEERILLPDGRVMIRRITVEEEIVAPGS